MLRNFLKCATIVALPLAISASAFAEDTAIMIANGKVKMNGLIKVWLVNDTSLGNQTLASTQVNRAVTSFRLRYAELKFSGAVTDNSRWVLAIDPAKNFGRAAGDGALFQDVGMTYNLMPELELTVGHFKVLTTAESLDPTGELLFPERSMVARTFGDYRELGATLSYSTEMFKVGAMVTNGYGGNANGGNTTTGNTLPNSGANRADIDAGNVINDSSPNNKNLYVRADVKPMEMVSLGAFTTLTDFSYGKLGVWGANVRFMPIEGAVIRLEGVRARQNNTTGLDQPRNGWVVDGGYQYGDWMPVARYEVQQAAGITGPSYTATAWTLGLNYLLNKNLSKLQFAFTGMKNATTGFAPSGTTLAAFGSPTPALNYNGGAMVLSFQTAF